jgi:hypothetical protein
MTIRRWLAVAAVLGLAGCGGTPAGYPVGWAARVRTTDGCAALAGSYRDAGDWLRPDRANGQAPAAFLALLTTGRPLPLVMQRFTVAADPHSLRIHFDGYGGETEDVTLSDRNGTLACDASGAEVNLIWKAERSGATQLKLMKTSDGGIAVLARQADGSQWYRFSPVR